MKSNKIQLSISKGFQEFIPVSLDFNQLDILTCSKNYSAITFKNKYRTHKNFQEASLCILDFDENLTLEDAKELFSEYKALIVTTKSHQKTSKNGKKIKKQDKFRVILIFSKTIKDYMTYRTVMKNLTIKYNSDKACFDAARFFYPNPYQKVWYSKGNKTIDINIEQIDNVNSSLYKNTRTIKIDKNDPLLIDNMNNQLVASEWAQKITNKTISIHCPNEEHEDVHPSAFISKSKKYENKIYIYCHKCGQIGIYPKLTTIQEKIQ